MVQFIQCMCELPGIYSSISFKLGMDGSPFALALRRSLILMNDARKARGGRDRNGERGRGQFNRRNK